MPQDYNQTLNVTKTDFPMKAGLPMREPVALHEWENTGVYQTLMQKNAGKPLYVLHDGPPYANGDIHLGTALNKILKDIIVRRKNMSGFLSPYVPGWDTHGLPIELQARKKAGVEASVHMPETELRRLCREFALGYVEGQKAQFKRLGVLGEWDDPYLTLKPAFEAKQIEIFGEMAHKGYIYKGLKPVYWCPECQTALAEAEIEYADDKCFSIYVKFNVTEDFGKLTAMGAQLDKTYFIIWTTTTWTLPGNLAISVGPAYDYSLIKAGGAFYVVAKELASATMQAAKITEYEELGTLKGSDLELMITRHPFLDRDSLVIVGDHVTLESGTGCVHTAPGHGVEDFEVCRNYPQLPIVVPVDAKGRMTDEAGALVSGKTTDEANVLIGKELERLGAMFAAKRVLHKYPHCWRCKQPILFRATEQWFCSIDGFKRQTLDAIQQVEWIPGWGQERIAAMVADRSDWCISRQRIWGVPIPIFYCADCGKELITPKTVAAVAEIFRKEGADAWYQRPAEDFLSGTACPHCKGTHFTKETDIMDVWFDSGSSHAAVCEERPYLRWPADLYLEGADQYRGWFQSSLLTSVACKGLAPYKSVLAHGWVVDGEGRKMSKSLGNGILPPEIVEKYGADILRLWVASSDYQSDIRISNDILKQLTELYRKIRNTARFILGNLNDFDPDQDLLPREQLEPIDRFALYKLDQLINRVNEAYEAFEFHTVTHAIHNFCVVDISNFYLDVLKDRLYIEKADSVTRRAAQTTLYRILDAITLMLAPILAFTADEIWQFMPHDAGRDATHAVFNQMPDQRESTEDEAFIARWETILALREDAQKALEKARTDKLIGSSLEAKVTITADKEKYNQLLPVAQALKAVLIVSELVLQEGDDPAIEVARTSGQKCERCWNFTCDVGTDSEHPTICKRCVEILR